ncbi:hypothetical protein BO78DRAFT_452043 [Aspergillus sclerotiicarbonarius CBS 121057]|uniref:FAD linked oxidase N-terminal domain-containing protein n=1 Tax=Aspergillus sclerotiicarbonarius (strain CBS 121057 / IBT 28362) TaxID=1448318 RepID=A0A319EHM7_ASPSB|nr:hypothetical protein BO78DRAFT_452043 [Aspergillus sclerotiicarbonarius CBS 121057]
MQLNSTSPSDLNGACCLALWSLLGATKVTFPGSQLYDWSLSSYFSQQEAQVQPRCMVAPSNVEDVSTALKSLTSIAALLPDEEKLTCDFAIQSGGHDPIGGAANIEGGVTLDLRGLNAIEGPIWGGSVFYSLDNVDQQLKAAAEFSAPESYDDYAALIVSFGFSGAQGAAIVNSIEYTKAEENPPAFQPFTEVPSLYSTLRIAPMSSIRY